MTRRRPPRPDDMALDRLVDHGLRYLARYNAGSGDLRRVLKRRLDRAVVEGVIAGEDAATRLDAALARLGDLGVVDDSRFAASLARSLRSRGRSAAAIAGRLARSGIGREAAAEAIAEADEAGGDPTEGEVGERAAAHRLARRRRLGPWRPAARVENRDRDVAALARAGFSVAIAIAVIDGDRGETP